MPIFAALPTLMVAPKGITSLAPRTRPRLATSWPPRLRRAQSRCFGATPSLEADFEHAIIGAGAVGLAVARRLAGREGRGTMLLERNGAVGMETSSRNSEVIHAGLYYGKGSLKTRLCIRGREMMYELCEKQNIPCKNLGKWIVAQTNEQWEELVKLHKYTQSINVPTEFISIDAAARLEPDVQALTGVLSSPTTGIIDSHAYMQYLLSDFTSLGGDLALHTTVTAITSLPNASGYEVTTLDAATGTSSTFTTETLVNSAGLAACHISNLLLPSSRHVTPFYAKGNYFSYNSTRPRASRLIYPAPEPGLGGLGTHLTLDIGGAIRFGPDVEWVDDPSDVSVNAERLPEAIAEIRKYLPGVVEDKVVPDYAGIRPKLGRSVVGEKGFVDFYISEEDGFEGFVNLLGIESPGLTASLAIAEMVEGLLYRKTIR